jgi:hypothetical protein
MNTPQCPGLNATQYVQNIMYHSFYVLVATLLFVLLTFCLKVIKERVIKYCEMVSKPKENINFRPFIFWRPVSTYDFSVRYLSEFTPKPPQNDDVIRKGKKRIHVNYQQGLSIKVDSYLEMAK